MQSWRSPDLVMPAHHIDSYLAAGATAPRWRPRWSAPGLSGPWPSGHHAASSRPL